MNCFKRVLSFNAIYAEPCKAFKCGLYKLKCKVQFRNLVITPHTTAGLGIYTYIINILKNSYSRRSLNYLNYPDTRHCAKIKN